MYLSFVSIFKLFTKGNCRYRNKVDLLYYTAPQDEVLIKISAWILHFPVEVSQSLFCHAEALAS